MEAKKLELIQEKVGGHARTIRRNVDRKCRFKLKRPRTKPVNVRSKTISANAILRAYGSASGARGGSAEEDEVEVVEEAMTSIDVPDTRGHLQDVVLPLQGATTAQDVRQIHIFPVIVATIADIAHLLPGDLHHAHFHPDDNHRIHTPGL